MQRAIRSVLGVALGALLLGCAATPQPMSTAPAMPEAAPPPVAVSAPPPVGSEPPPAAPPPPQALAGGAAPPADAFDQPKGETAGFEPGAHHHAASSAKLKARQRGASLGTMLVGRPAAPAAALPNFPWPPPTPSERLNFRRAQILTAAMGRDPSLADVARRIVQALESAGYSEYSFYAAPDGFAIVARLERIEPDGTPAPDKLRFLAPDTAEPFSLAAYVARLFFAPEGYYRQIVFLVTPAVVRPAGPTPSAKAAEAILQGGADRLPAAYRSLRFTPDDQVTALIYEYHKGPDARDVTSLNPGRLDARTNLVRAGIYAQLVGVRR